jgi:HAD superfamily hydrolase (TIGR01493 family)
MNKNNEIKAVIFDAYGTLFDVYSVGALAEELFPGNGKALANIWRERQIDYTRLRTLCDQYIDFGKSQKTHLNMPALLLNSTLPMINLKN